MTEEYTMEVEDRRLVIRRADGSKVFSFTAKDKRLAHATFENLKAGRAAE